MPGLSRVCNALLNASGVCNALIATSGLNMDGILHLTNHQQALLPGFFYGCTVNTGKDITFRMVNR